MPSGDIGPENDEIMLEQRAPEFRRVAPPLDGTVSRGMIMETTLLWLLLPMAKSSRMGSTIGDLS